jgi:hypothetical protein
MRRSTLRAKEDWESRKPVLIAWRWIHSGSSANSSGRAILEYDTSISGSLAQKVEEDAAAEKPE